MGNIRPLTPFHISFGLKIMGRPGMTHVPCTQVWTLWLNIVPGWLKLRMKVSDGAGVSCGIKRPAMRFTHKALRHSQWYFSGSVFLTVLENWENRDTNESPGGQQRLHGGLGGSLGLWPSRFPIVYGLQAYAFGADIAPKKSCLLQATRWRRVSIKGWKT